MQSVPHIGKHNITDTYFLLTRGTSVNMPE
jgi:hypothetical protein